MELVNAKPATEEDTLQIWASVAAPTPVPTVQTILANASGATVLANQIDQGEYRNRQGHHRSRTGAVSPPAYRYTPQAGSFSRNFRLLFENLTEQTRILTQCLSPHLFWDIDREHFDVETHSTQLIQRVLEYGEFDDWYTVRDYYGLDRIARDCKTLRTLRPEALSFICVVTDTKKEDYRCYTFRQSHPTPWNS